MPIPAFDELKSILTIIKSEFLYILHMLSNPTIVDVYIIIHCRRSGLRNRLEVSQPIERSVRTNELVLQDRSVEHTITFGDLESIDSELHDEDNVELLDTVELVTIDKQCLRAITERWN